MNNTIDHGAILTVDNDTIGRIEKWDLSSNLEYLSTIPDDEVLWVGSSEELIAKLNELHPPKLGLPYVSETYTGAKVYPVPIVKAGNELGDEGEYRGPYDEAREKDRRERINVIRTERIMNAVKTVGTVFVIGQCSGPTREVYDQCVVISGNSGSLVEYNPKMAAKKKEQAFRKSLTKSISAFTIANCGGELRSYLRHRFAQPSVDGNLCRAEYLSNIRDVLWQFETLYGKGMFRKTTIWQSFVKQWRDLQVPTEKMFAKEVANLNKGERKDDDWSIDRVRVIEEFVAFMRIEVKKRMPKVLNREEILKLAAVITLPGTPKKAKPCQTSDSAATVNESAATLIESGTP